MKYKAPNLSKQKIFNLSVRGLRSQGFQRCLDDHKESPEPVYAKENGMRCAWGWVDRTLQPGGSNTYYVEDLAMDQIGVACHLTMDLLEFGRQLQECHDLSNDPRTMERRLRRLGERYGLKWPD